MDLINRYQPYLTWLEQQAHTMQDYLEKWAAINSGTYHLAGLARMQEALAQAFSELRGEQTILDVSPLQTIALSGETEVIALGKVLRIRKRPTAPHQVLLVGHLDTVFDQHHPFQQVRLAVDQQILYGPGVADMKGGLVVMLFALLALERSPWADQLGWEVMINADEEIGSPGSAAILEQAAHHHELGLVFEPALDVSGTVASARKGSGKFTFIMHGKAAHAGRAIQQGRNAIVALSELVLQLDALNNQREGVTVNVGLIHGGRALNVVPDRAVCQVDVRTTCLADEEWLQQQMQPLLSSFNQREGYKAVCSGGFTRKPKLFTPATENLFKRVKYLSEQLGNTLQWQSVGGCCDGNNLAAQGLPVIDSLGVRGGAIHTAEEFVILESLVERARLTALLLMTLASDGI